MKKKIYLYGYTLGDSAKDCPIHDSDIHSMFWKTKKEARAWMKNGMKENHYKCGMIVKLTMEKVRP